MFFGLRLVVEFGGKIGVGEPWTLLAMFGHTYFLCLMVNLLIHSTKYDLHETRAELLLGILYSFQLSACTGTPACVSTTPGCSCGSDSCRPVTGRRAGMRAGTSPRS